jgi:hypothetical protein
MTRDCWRHVMQKREGFFGTLRVPQNDGGWGALQRAEMRLG